VILPNQVQILVTPQEMDSLSKTIQSLCRRYTQLFNHHHLRQSTIWAGRYFSQLLLTQEEHLEFQKKIELSPLKEHLVSHLEEYPWSSYNIHIGKEPNYGLQDLIAFWNLGNTPFERQRCWEQLLVQE
jgi:putative transposase